MSYQARTNWTESTSLGHYTWVPSPNTRGTMDIIWPCVSTLALCLWSMLHLNLPALDDCQTTQILRKIRWLLLGILAPELPMLFAFAQKISAKQSVEDMKAFGYSDWTITHGFYADSGGFLLRADGIELFPVTAKQILYLVRNGYIDMPNITQAEIKDKSKANCFTKGLAFFQSGWLITRLIARGAQGLEITPLELVTSALVFCALITLWMWWHKPLDVRAPTIIYASCDISSLLVAAGEAAKSPFSETPLDFVEPDIYWSRIPNDRDFRPSDLKENICLAFPICVFAGIHFLGWNLQFPTLTEQRLWRINCFLTWGGLSVYGVTEMVGFWRANYSVASMEVLGAYKKRMPWRIIFLGMSTLYFSSRVCLLLEAVASLRDLPNSAFSEVVWTQFLPRL